MVKHDKINGEDYKKLIINAAQCLENNKEEINELNVFPVPDGDTGSNMSMTISNAAEELLRSSDMPLDIAADKTAKAMLHGARGNSGVIISLLFRGIAKGLASVSECDGKAWANALKSGVESAYGAVECPAEGTILTVARRSAEEAEAASNKNNDFEYVLKECIKAAELALAETIKQNPVLEKAGVVDAGGKGWLLVMQAMLNALEGKDVIDISSQSIKRTPSKKADFASFDTEDIKFAFCTEFIVKKHIGDSDTSDFKKYLNSVGDSLVMIDDGEIIKVHVHTNQPYEVIGMAQKYGVYETVKIENMRTQHTNKLVSTEGSNEKELKKYGFVSVSNGDGINDMFRELGVDEIVSGGQTMNPSTEELVNAINKVDAETVFVLPNNKNIIMTANQASLLINDKKVVVIPTKSIPQGFSAFLGFMEEESAEANEESMKEAMLNVDTIQITYAVKNSDFGGFNISEGDYLALYENQILCSDKDQNVLLKALANKVKTREKSFVSIYYGSDVSDVEAQNALDIFAKELGSDVEINLYSGKQPVYYYIISAE